MWLSWRLMRMLDYSQVLWFFSQFFFLLLFYHIFNLSHFFLYLFSSPFCFATIIEHTNKDIGLKQKKPKQRKSTENKCDRFLTCDFHPKLLKAELQLCFVEPLAIQQLEDRTLGFYQPDLLNLQTKPDRFTSNRQYGY